MFSRRGTRLSAPHEMVRAFIRQEAVLSSRINGTRTTREELLAQEATQLSLLELNADARE